MAKATAHGGPGRVGAGEATPTFAVTRAADTTVLVIEGELDLAAVTELRPSVDELLASSPASVLVDLRGVTFIDSKGVDLLLRIRGGVAKRNGATTRLVEVSPTAHRVLELCGVLNIFEFAEEDPSE